MTSKGFHEGKSQSENSSQSLPSKSLVNLSTIEREKGREIKIYPVVDDTSGRFDRSREEKGFGFIELCALRYINRRLENDHPNVFYERRLYQAFKVVPVRARKQT